jgi:DivIVA domain-containing protein
MSDPGSRPRGERFTVVRWKPGYDIEEVDAVFDWVALGGATPEQVKGTQFKSVRLRPAYDEREVDDALDEVVARLHASGVQDPPPPPPKTGWRRFVQWFVG